METQVWNLFIQLKGTDDTFKQKFLEFWRYLPRKKETVWPLCPIQLRSKAQKTGREKCFFSHCFTANYNPSLAPLSPGNMHGRHKKDWRFWCTGHPRCGCSFLTNKHPNRVFQPDSSQHWIFTSLNNTSNNKEAKFHWWPHLESIKELMINKRSQTDGQTDR